MAAGGATLTDRPGCATRHCGSAAPPPTAGRGPRSLTGGEILEQDQPYHEMTDIMRRTNRGIEAVRLQAR